MGSCISLLDVLSLLLTVTAGVVRVLGCTCISLLDVLSLLLTVTVLVFILDVFLIYLAGVFLPFSAGKEALWAA